MRLFKACLLAIAVSGLASGLARADVKPHPIFTENMVLQQGVPIPVWGKAEPGEQVQVSLQRNAPGEASAAVSSVQADKDGNWKVSLPAQKAATGYTLTFKGNNTITFKNVAVGEVWAPVSRTWR